VIFAAHATVPDIITFVVAAILCLVGAAGVVVSKNPVHAALSLVTTLFGVAILFVEQEAHFLAAVQIIVYAGAIVVLFLFVIMLLGVDKTDDNNATPDRFRAWRPFAVVLSLAVGGLIVGLANWDWKATGTHAVGGQASGGGSNIDKLADSIFQQYLFPFEATSLLLVIAVVGAVVLARRPTYEDDMLPDDAETEIEVGVQ
jgi:NADH-quinone oxidoreductase subunit J